MPGLCYPSTEIFKPPFPSQGLAAYAGQVALRAALPAALAASSKVAIQVQACNDKCCLAPSTLPLPVDAAR